MATGEPRPDHIALLTRDTPLPLLRIEDEHLSIILETIFRAWTELQALGMPILSTGSEADVNALLDPQLNHMCMNDRYWKGLVHSVQRGRETMSYNGVALEKRPDLSLIFLHGDRNFPLVVECKIIDHANDKAVRLYCNEGIARFVSGDYSWARREAIMLAYVRDGSTVPAKLAPHLAKSAKVQPDLFLTSTMLGPRDGFPDEAHFTIHNRAFQYLPCCNGSDPGPITLAHLWLTQIE